MTKKLKVWNPQTTWEQSELEWDSKVKEASLETPLKGLGKLPNMVGITKETARYLKWKSLKWMISKDHLREIRNGFLKHPFKYGWAFIKSCFKTKPYKKDGDFFYYGVDNLDQFKESLKEVNTLLVVGFSYCHKPFECPSGRFTSECVHDASHPVCRQCFIGKAIHALPEKKVIPLIIPTIHYVGGQIFKIVHQNPSQKVLFMITACEMTLEMFGDWGNMVNIKGIGVRLDGRICNTMKAFELSEMGIKPGLTVVLESTQRKVMDLIRLRRENSK